MTGKPRAYKYDVIVKKSDITRDHDGSYRIEMHKNYNSKYYLK